MILIRKLTKKRKYCPSLNNVFVLNCFRFVVVVGSLTLGVLSSITEFEPMLSGYALYLVSSPLARCCD